MDPAPVLTAAFIASRDRRTAVLPVTQVGWTWREAPGPSKTLIVGRCWHGQRGSSIGLPSEVESGGLRFSVDHPVINLDTACVFDRAYVQSHNVFVDPLDVGALGEVALFYGDVELVLGSGSLRQLILQYDADQVIEFVSQGYVNPHYSHSFTAIRSEGLGGPEEWHTPITARIATTAEAEIVRIFRECTGRSGYGARKARAFIDAVRMLDLDDDWAETIRANFANEALVCRAIAATARHALGPNEGANVTISDLDWSGDGLRLKLGGEWNDLQAEYERRRGEPLTTAHLLSPLVASLTDLQMASRFSADISTGHLGNELLRIKCEELERSTAARPAGLADFQNHVLQSRDVRGALNSGSRDLRDLMQLLDRADRFKGWVQGKPLEADLVVRVVTV